MDQNWYPHVTTKDFWNGFSLFSGCFEIDNYTSITKDDFF